MSIHNFTIGADPEIFVKRNGRLVTAHGLIPGDKQNPHKVENGAVQVDGMALEFNIDPVSAADFETFNRRVVGVMKTMRSMLPSNHSFCIQPSVEFDKNYYDSCPEQAKMLGCDPDFNAWEDGKENEAPDGQSGLRSAAGHIHIGWGNDIPIDNPEHIAICCDFVRELDVYVGLLTLLFDGDNRRRQLYGKAGAFRPKPYGVEYRVPSNAWLSSKARRSAIFDAVGLCITRMPNPARLSAGLGDAVQRIINEGDRAGAAQIYNNSVSSLRTLPREITAEFDFPRFYGDSTQIGLKK